MAAITKFPIYRHLRADATAYVQHTAHGKVLKSGAGQAFWFRPLTAALSEVPLADRNQALFFHARTADFQDVTVQATVNYRVVDPELAATRIDFGIDPATGAWNANPLETLGGLLTELAQQPALDQVAHMTMEEALANGLAPVQERIAESLADDARLPERGLAVLDVRVVAIQAEPELERALQAETRERIQQDADKATFERRALAVESERAIAENELANQIELARREADLVAQRGKNERQRATENAAADRIRAEAGAAEERLAAEAAADSTRMVGEAEAVAEAAKLAAYRDLKTATLIGLAARELAGNLPAIENLTITPDLLTQALAQFVTAANDPEPAPEQGDQR